MRIQNPVKYVRWIITLFLSKANILLKNMKTVLFIFPFIFIRKLQFLICNFWFFYCKVIVRTNTSFSQLSVSLRFKKSLHYIFKLYVKFTNNKPGHNDSRIAQKMKFSIKVSSVNVTVYVFIVLSLLCSSRGEETQNSTFKFRLPL